MDYILSIPFLPLIVVSSFLGALFMIGHFHKKMTCDHTHVEFIQAVAGHRYHLEISCYCGKEVGRIVREADKDGWFHAFGEVSDTYAMSTAMMCLLTVVHSIFAILSALFLIVGIRPLSRIARSGCYRVDAIIHNDLLKMRYIDRRNERLAKYVDSCTLEVMKTAD